MKPINKKSSLFRMLISIILFTIMNVKHKIQMSLKFKINNNECA